MIGKLIKGRSIRGLLDYLLSERDQKGEVRPQVKIVGGTFAGRTARLISQEFAVLRALRPRLEVAVVHETLRLPPNASEPTDELWRSIAKFWTARMGFQTWIAVSHGDGHIHIAASRILIDGSVVSDSNDWTLSERVIREIEAEFGLEGIRPSHLLDASRDWVQQKSATRQQLAVAERTGLALPSDIIASTIDYVVSRNGSVTDLVTALEAAGVDVRANVASTGRVAGLAYRVGNITVTAKAMGRGYTWANLLKAGLNYEEARDLPVLIAATARSRASAPEDLVTGTSAGGLKISDPYLGAATLVFDTSARFVDAMACEELTVILERDGRAVSLHATASELRNPEHLQQLQMENRNATIGIATDRRVVLIGSLNREAIEMMLAFGFQPSAVVEIKPGEFEAAVRLLPAAAAEPSPEIHNFASAVLARSVSGVSLPWLRFPGFVNRSADAVHRKRRPQVYLRMASQVIADLGARFVRWIEATLKSGSLAHEDAALSRDTIFTLQSVVTAVENSEQGVPDNILLQGGRSVVDPALLSVSDEEAVLDGHTVHRVSLISGDSEETPSFEP